MSIRKLCIYPDYVWKDITSYIWNKYKITSPKHPFKISSFIHSKKFDYRKFVANITEKQAMVLFTLICRKLGVGFITDSDGWQIICLEETAEELLKFVKTEVHCVEPVKQPED